MHYQELDEVPDADDLAAWAQTRGLQIWAAQAKSVRMPSGMMNCAAWRAMV